MTTAYNTFRDEACASCKYTTCVPAPRSFDDSLHLMSNFHVRSKYGCEILMNREADRPDM